MKNKTIQCPKCGQTIPNDSSFCQSCGSKIEIVYDNNPPKAKLSLLAKILLISTYTLLFAAIIVLSVFFVLKTDEYKSKIAEQKDTISNHELTISEQKDTISNHELTIAEQKDTISNHELTIAEQKDTIDSLKVESQMWKDKYLNENLSTELYFESVLDLKEAIKSNPSFYEGKTISVIGYYNYNDYSYYNKYSSIYNSLSSSNSPSGLSYEIIIDNYTKAILDDADHILLTGTIRANYDGELYLDDCKVEILE